MLRMSRNDEASRFEVRLIVKYAVVIEKGPTSYGATVPDLPGCVAVAETLEEVETLIREAIDFHIDGLRQDGLPVPPPTTICEYVETQAA